MVHVRIRHSHQIAASLNVQFGEFAALPDTGASSGGLGEFLAALNDFRPDWKRSALRWLDRVNRAARFSEKRALCVLRVSESSLILGAVQIALLEFRNIHLQELGDSYHIVLA